MSSSNRVRRDMIQAGAMEVAGEISKETDGIRIAVSDGFWKHGTQCAGTL